MIIETLGREQEKHGWVSADAARAIAEELRVPLHRIEGVLSFYPHFRRTPPVRMRIDVCRDVSCRLRGGAELCRAALALASGDVEAREVSCLGRCDDSPAASVNDVPLARATPARLAAVAAGAEPLPVPEDPPPARAWCLATDLPEAPPFDADAVIAVLREAGLRGLGGAGFPTADKWALVRRTGGEGEETPKFVVGNADESEPGTFKDRVCLEEMPDLVIEGVALAARVVGATRAIVYLRHEYARAGRALAAALARARARDRLPCPTEIFISPGGYILGEETALLEALEDRRGEPRNKPPFPGTHGLFGKPTVINNVETLAAAAAIVRRGAAWWRGQGVRGASGTKLISVSGHIAQPGVYEIAMGTTVAELIERAGGVPGRLLAFAPGGASSNWLPAARADTPIDFAPMAAAGSMLGSGALIVAAEGTDLLDVAASVTRFFRNESCGKCVPCRAGSDKAARLLDDFAAGRSSRVSLDVLPDLEETMRLTSICGLGQVALGPALSILRGFPEAAK